MARSLIPGALTICALALASASPAQTRDRAPADDIGTGRLAGQVVAADTGRPVARAHVTIAQAGGKPRPAGASLTDETGSFLFAGLPAGRYSVSATKAGAFLQTHYGQSAGDLPGRLVSIESDEEKRIEIRLLRAGVIAGRVLDEAGDPLPLVSVTALRQQTAGSLDAASAVDLKVPTIGTRSFPGVHGTQTDDRGEYRIFGLQPGEYLVFASTPVVGRNARRAAPIYYPGVVDPGAATRLVLTPGEEIADASFMFRTVPTVIVSGIAVGPDDGPLAGGTIALHVPHVEGVIGLAQIATIREDGTFSFEALAGQYVLRARSAPQHVQGRYAGSLSLGVPLSVGDTDVSGLLLKLTYGASLRGRITFEGSGAVPDPAGFRVTVESGGLGERAEAGWSPNGTVSLSGIESGTRRILASGAPGWVLKAIYVNGRDVADEDVEFRDGVALTDVAVVFTDAKAPLQITVQHATQDGTAMVAIFPADQTLWNLRSRRTRFLPAAPQPAMVDTLPAGDYLVAALAETPVIVRPDPALLNRIRPHAVPVKLVEGSPSSVQVRAVLLPR